MLKLSAKADKELLSSALWYDEQRIGLGDKFIEAVKKKLELIRKYPERYPQRFKHFRETTIQNFPYIIVYTINDDIIIIESIFHASRKPSKKYK